MCFARAMLVVFSFLVAIPAIAQQSVAASNQGTAVLQEALAALAPSTPIRDITLSGTARRIAGSDDESGTVIIQGLAGTGSLLSLTLPSGPRTELRNISSVPIAGSWSGPDGITHAMVYHNLLTDPGWVPALTIAALLSAPNTVIAYIGPETRSGQSVIHVSASQQSPVASDTTGMPQHLTQTEVYLNATTLLPTAIAFSTHGDNNASLDIPVEVDFSSYQTVSGSQIPFHVQKFLNYSLVLDLQFTSATLNSGIPASAFNLR